MATPCAHAQLTHIHVSCRAVTGMCCSSQPEPALTDQSRHRERCNSISRARRTVLATKSLDLSLGALKNKKALKGSEKSLNLATKSLSWQHCLQQSDDTSDYYLVLCLHIAKAVNSTPSYKYGRTITSTTKDFVYFLTVTKLDVTETMDTLFSSTLDTVAPLRLRKIKEKSPTSWYNEHTCALKRAARKMERS